MRRYGTSGEEAALVFHPIFEAKEVVKGGQRGPVDPDQREIRLLRG